MENFNFVHQNMERLVYFQGTFCKTGRANSFDTVVVAQAFLNFSFHKGPHRVNHESGSHDFFL